MTWARIDDSLCRHLKPLRAGLEAMGLWVLCLSYTGSTHRPFVEREVVIRLAGSEAEANRLACRLLEAGLWLEHPAGWAFHDWAAYNLTAEQAEALSRKRARAGRKGGRRSAEQRVKHLVEQNEANGKQEATKTQAAPDPVPVPDPSVPPSGGLGGVLEIQEPETVTRSRKATRCPVSTDPGALTFCRAHGIPPPTDPEARSFLDYWGAVPGAKGLKLDWAATWRNRPPPREARSGPRIVPQPEGPGGPLWKVSRPKGAGDGRS